MTWLRTEPVEGILAPSLNDVIRDNNDALEIALNKEMNFSTGGEASLQGILKQGSARMFAQASAPATRVDGSAFASTDLGMIWIKTSDNKIYTLTAITPTTWTLISTEIIALLVSQINTWALAQTLSVSPVFTKGIVANATYLKGRNKAGDANTDMIQVGRNEADNTDVVKLPDKARLASNAAPTEDTQLVIKKYVDGLVQTLGAYEITTKTGTSSAPNEFTKTPATDGFLTVTMKTTDTSSVANILINVDGVEVAMLAVAGEGGALTPSHATATIPVRSGQAIDADFIVTTAISNRTTKYIWTPLS